MHWNGVLQQQESRSYITTLMILLSWAFQNQINVAILLKAVCNDLGIPLAPEKQAGSATVIEFLDVVTDTSHQELLPANNFEHLQSLTVDLKFKIHRQLQAKNMPILHQMGSRVSARHYAPCLYSHTCWESLFLPNDCSC